MVTYIHRPDPRQTDGDLSSYLYYFDTSLRLWTIYPIDGQNNQIGDAEYTPTKEHLKEAFPQLKFQREKPLPKSAHKVVRLEAGGPWHLVGSQLDEERTVCFGDALDEYEASAEGFAMREVARGGITCEDCLRVVRSFKAIKF